MEPVEARQRHLERLGSGRPRVNRRPRNAGRGYSDAFGDWLLSTHLDLPAPPRAKLLVLMGNLTEIEQWRLTLTPDTAAADEPSGHRAEELLASDRGQAGDEARQS